MHRARSLCTLAGLVAGLLLSPACGDDGAAQPPTGALGGPCYEDATCDGELVCLSGICREQPACVLDAVEACDCPDGAVGHRVCRADGTWSACECPAPSLCGNGLLDAGEECDGANHAGRTCASEGFASGELACDPTRCTLVTTGCYRCGPDGTPCDASDLCTAVAECQDDACVRTPKDCSGTPVPDDCHVAVCDPQTGGCVVTVGNEGGACDAAFCEVNGTCANGLCVNTEPNTCGIQPPNCHVVVCDAATRSCSAEPDTDGAACVTPDLCQLNPACLHGRCVGTVRDCQSSPFVECNNVACVPATGECEATPDPSLDGQPCLLTGDRCEVSKVCVNGECKGGIAVDCSHLFVQRFETCPPPGWTLGGDWQCGVPTTIGPASTVSDTQCLGTIINGNYHNNQSWGTAVADSPPIDLTAATEPVLSFWIWIHTEGWTYDGGNLRISTDGGATFSLLTTDLPYTLTVGSQPAWGGNQSSRGWRFVTADLLPYVGQWIILRYAFRTDTVGVRPGIYVDDVLITEVAEVPLSITSPSPLFPAFVDGPYRARLQRVGGTANALWSITGGTNHGWLGIDPVTGELSGTPTQADLGAVSVDVRVEEPATPGNFDDRTYLFEVVTPLYVEDFEGPCPSGWSLVPDWECGTPANVGPSAAFSGTQCIATQIDATFSANQAWSTATSPAIDLTSALSPQAKFLMWMHSEWWSEDGINLKVSTDGVTFSLLSAVTPPYNFTAAGEPVWGGDQSAGGWRIFSADLSAYAGQTIWLQFALRTDNMGQLPGFYIDDVSVFE